MRSVRLLLFPLTLLGLAALPPEVARAQAPTTADAAYDRVQQVRIAAEEKWLARDPAGIRMLEALLAWLADSTMRDLTQGSVPLQSRTANIWYDLAQARQVAGDTAGALDALEQLALVGAGGAYAGFLETDSILTPLASSARYQAVLAASRRERRRWSDSAFASPYRPTLTDAEKVAGLSLFWAEARYGFAGFKLVPALDWDSLYLATIPRVLAARDTWEYYRALQAFAAELRDSHTDIVYPRRLMDSLWIRPGLRTARIEGRVLLLEVQAPSLAPLGLAPGQEIVAVDGIPVERYAETMVAPWVSWATPQDREVRTYSYHLLRGPREVPVRLRVRDAAGREREVSVPRLSGREVQMLPPLSARLLPGRIGYVAINTFNEERVPALFDSAMATLGELRGLVIDIRRNGGGSSSHGWAVLQRLATGPFRTTLSRLQRYDPTYRAWGQAAVRPVWAGASTIMPHDSIHHRMPVAVLIGPATFSAAEDFAAVYDMMGRGLLIGEATGGNTGQPLFFPLPGGGSARVRTKHDRYLDGTEFVGVGVQPDRVVRPTVAAVRAGRDEVLEQAIATLGSTRSTE